MKSSSSWIDVKEAAKIRHKRSSICIRCPHCCEMGTAFALIGAGGNVVWLADPNEKLPLARVVGSPLENLVVPADRPAVANALKRTLDNGLESVWVSRSKITGRRVFFVLQPVMIGEVKAVLHGCPICRKLSKLSRSQRSVLAKMSDGMSVGQVARRYDVSQNTVRTHLSRSKQSLEANDLTELLLWAKANRRFLLVKMQ